jgi:methionine-rich copper-binding protein CopC
VTTRSTTRMRPAAAAVLAVVLGWLTLLPAAPAWAHAALIGSDPEAGATLAALPGVATLEFSEEMADPAYVVVTAADGTTVTDGDPVVDGRQVTQALVDGPAGTYTLAFRVVSGDGHPVTGEMTFTVTSGTSPEPDPTPAGTTGATPAADAGTDPGGEDAGASAVPSEPGFWQVHGTHVVVGVLLFALAGLLLLLSRRSPG